MKVRPFKKGPDYIDPSWLAAAAGNTCGNLDPFMFNEAVLIQAFRDQCAGTDIALIEASMGLYDSPEEDGHGSSAWLARLLGVPVILVVNAQRMTRSAAAMVKGYMDFEPGTGIAGVILNNVNGRRHINNLVRSVEKHCGIPVLGCLPCDNRLTVRERHLGIVPCIEQDDAAVIIEKTRSAIENNIDIDLIIAIAKSARADDAAGSTDNRAIAQSSNNHVIAGNTATNQPPISPKVRIGILYDKAFSFYYPDNLKALRDAGAGLVYINSFKDNLPAVDGLYIGGGFPELYAAELEANHNLRSQIAAAARDGLPIYAECAGLMYLSRSVIMNRRCYSMAGIFEADIDISTKPQGHGYVKAEVQEGNPFFKAGTILKGHEFHYSKLIGGGGLKTSYKITRGHGIDGHSDGLTFSNTLASYLHLHALSAPGWAFKFVNLAFSHKINPAGIAA